MTHCRVDTWEVDMVETLRWLAGKDREQFALCRGPVAANAEMEIADCRLWVIDALMTVCRKEAVLDDARTAELWARICSMAAAIVSSRSSARSVAPVNFSDVETLAKEFGLCGTPDAR